MKRWKMQVFVLMFIALLALPVVSLADRQKAAEAGVADALIAVFNEMCFKTYGESEESKQLSAIIEASGYRAWDDYYFANNRMYDELTSDPELKPLLDGTADKAVIDEECKKGRPKTLEALISGFTR